MNNFSLKELYDVALKATYPIEIDGKVIEAGETIAFFDQLQIANFDEKKSLTTARGGQDARALIFWEETKELALSFSQGIFSKTQLSLMTNAQLIQSNDKPIKINKREIVETDEEGYASTKFLMCERPYVYDVKSGQKITSFTWNEFKIDTYQPFIEVMIDYQFNYLDKVSILTVGQPLTNGFLSLEGKTRVKDDTTGQVKTGIIRIPKLKLLSNLSMRLGKDAIPQVGRLDAIAVPTGPKGQKMVMELIFLEDDIDSDM